MKTRKKLKVCFFSIAMLGATGGASALDIAVNQSYKGIIDYNFQPGQELMSFGMEEDNKFARFLSSSLTVNFERLFARGTMALPPPKTESVALAAGISAVAKPDTRIYNTQAGQVLNVWNDASSSFTQKVNQPLYSKVNFGFSDQSQANNSRIVLTDSSLAVIRPEYGFGPQSPIAVSQVRGNLSGKLILEAEYLVNYQVDSAFDKMLGWLDNVNDFSFIAEAKRVIREKQNERLQHATANELKLLFKKKDASLGVRGEVTFEGMTVHTASPGVLAYTATLPNALSIDVPLAFTKNNVGAVLDVAFDGQTLATFRGDEYLTDEINLLNIDISSFAGKSGELTFTINTSGLDSAEIFVAERLGGLKINTAVLTPVPEPGTFAMMLAGLGLLAGVARRRR